MNREIVIGIALTLAALAAGVSFALSFASARLALEGGAVDQPTGGRKIHTKPIPLWGGLGIAIAIFLAVFLAVHYGLLPQRGFDLTQLAGFVLGILILLVGGLIDDRHPLPPFVQLLFPMLAAISVIASGTGIVQVTNPTTHLGFSLVWWKLGPASLPADLITFLWLLVATYATKILDGLDGLVSGMAVIGAGLVGALSTSVSFFQPGIALLSAIVGGAYLGFLPRNANPAKQFLGEAGGTIAGFSLGVLAILSGAKVAIALTVLAIPITDVALVVVGRIRRGVAWYKGDNTHLHFRLIQLGLSQRAAALLLWGVSLGAGLVALTLQTRGKLFLIGMLVVLTAIASYAAGLKGRRASGVV